MKTVLLTVVTLLALLLPAQGWADVTASTQHTTISQNTSPITTAALATTTGSGLITSCLWSSGQTFSSISENGGNGAPTLIGIEKTGVGRSRVYYWPNITGNAAHTVTWTLSAGAPASCFVLEILTNNGGGITLDQGTQGNDNSSPWADLLTITTTIATELLVSVAYGNSAGNPDNWTAGASFTRHEHATNGASFWAGAIGSLHVSSTGTYNGSWTDSVSSSNTNVHIASFSEAAAPTSTCKGALMLLGVGGC